MTEFKTLVDNKQLMYEGLLDVREFLRLLDMWFKERGYDKRETKNYQAVYEEGKQITVEMFPYKKVSDNVRFELRLYMVFFEVQDVDVEISGVKQHLQKSRVEISYDAYLLTDYENKWAKTPTYFFLHTLFDKYFFRNYIKRAEYDFLRDCARVEEEIKS
ncbi:MAG: hypothetical protein ABIH41_07110, partial [Nanoarchaeota archaeon]